jgi:DNA replication protein DnaC
MAEKMKNLMARLKDTGFEVPTRINLSVENARQRLYNGLSYMLKQQGEHQGTQWLPEYEQIACWLSDNKGKGLLPAGSCGRGKTLIATRVLPLFFAERHLVYNIFNSYDLNRMQREVFGCKILCIDDLGIENESVQYGERRNVFVELIDSVEKKGKLLVVTTNLAQSEIVEKYGTRTIDRIYSCCKIVPFNGCSLRK